MIPKYLENFLLSIQTPFRYLSNSNVSNIDQKKKSNFPVFAIFLHSYFFMSETAFLFNMSSKYYPKSRHWMLWDYAASLPARLQ